MVIQLFWYPKTGRSPSLVLRHLHTHTQMNTRTQATSTTAAAEAAVQ